MKRVRSARFPGILIAALALVVAIAGCGPGSSESASKGGLKVVATTSFLRDIAQNVAADRFTVGELVPIGVDPHEWQPAPSDLVTVSKSDLVIVNGGGLEGALLKDMQNAGGGAQLVTASRGLATRVPKPGEPGYGQSTEVDPHWWLDPIDVITYVNNIRDAL